MELWMCLFTLIFRCLYWVKTTYSSFRLYYSILYTFPQFLQFSCSSLRGSAGSMFRWHPDKFEQKFGRSGAPVKWIKHQKFTGKHMCFLLAPSCWFHEKLHEFLMLESPSWFWWFGGWLSSTLRFLPKKEQDWKSSTLMCSNSSSNVEVWLGKWRLGWPFALLYKWKMMWTLTIAGFLALSINSIFFISIASRFVNIQNSDVFAYRFWAVKARSVFLSWPVSRPPFWDLFDTLFRTLFRWRSLKKNKNVFFWRWGDGRQCPPNRF